MAYADYAFYKQEYCGDSVPEDAFNRCVARASEKIDSLTRDAARTYTVDNRVKLCACAIAEEVYRGESGGVVVSQSVGSWSQTFAQGATPERRVYAIAVRYLGSTGLLYRGV